MNVNDIVKYIHELGCEYDIMNYLVNWSRNQLTSARYKNKELIATISAVKAINDSKGKNEAIEALCSDEDDKR